MSYHVDKKGYYGQFGGAFIPEMLYPNIEELQQNEFKALYPNQKPTPKELVLDTDFEIFFPTDYINNVTERLTQYQELATLKSEEELTAFGASLVDRFGALPEPTLALFDSVRLKWLGASLGFEKIILKIISVCHKNSFVKKSFQFEPSWKKCRVPQL